MKTILLLVLSIAAFSVEEVKPEDAPSEPVRTLTEADLQNLIACARLQLQGLTPDQISSVAIAIKHAEADREAMQKSKAVPVEVKKP